MSVGLKIVVQKKNQFYARQVQSAGPRVQQRTIIPQEPMKRLNCYLKILQNLMRFRLQILTQSRGETQNLQPKQLIKDSLEEKIIYLKHCETLYLTEEEGTVFNKVKRNFKSKIRSNVQLKGENIQNSKQIIQKRRKNRGDILVAYHYLTNRIYDTTYSPEQAEFIEAILRGISEKVKRMIEQQPKWLLFRMKGTHYPILYLAATTGHTDIVEMILKTGCSLNFENDVSTPLHAAACYYHYHVVELLLKYGVPYDINNSFGQKPIEDTNGEIQELLQKIGNDQFILLGHKLIEKNLCKTVVNIQKDGQVVLRKILMKNYDKPFRSHIDAYHGTEFQNLESIATHGLKKTGSYVDGRRIEVKKNHIPQGVEIKGDRYWANKIYTSPSIYYAGEYTEFERYYFDNKWEEWKPIVQVKLREGSYKECGQTMNGYDSGVTNEPEYVEFQNDNEKDVQVVALMLVKRSFLGRFNTERRGHEFDVTQRVVLENVEEKMVRSYSSSKLF